MRTWSLTSQPTAAGKVSDAVLNLVTAIGSGDFAERLLHEVNEVLPVGCWSVYRVGNSPEMYLSGTHQRRDTTIGSWSAYLSGPHLSDRTLALDCERFSKPTVCHVTAEEIPSSLHRDKVYRQFDMSERLSIAEQDGPGAVFAVNLYRYSDQRHFSDAELAAFEILAPAMFASVRRHLALRQAKPVMQDGRLSISGLRQILQRERPDLTGRELDVCARALTGMSYEGIAADLGLKVPTVKTYRNRAFERLGIRFRSELTRYCLAVADPSRQP